MDRIAYYIKDNFRSESAQLWDKYRVPDPDHPAEMAAGWYSQRGTTSDR